MPKETPKKEQYKEAEALEDPDLGLECKVCYEFYLQEDFYWLECKHDFCTNCVIDHLKGAIATKTTEIPCM